MKNKIFSILTSLMLCLWALPVNIAFAEDDYSPFKGSGTSSDPYQISSDYELRLLSELVADEDTEISDKYAKACYIQTADIDLKNENFIPIGSFRNMTELNKPFRGNYNGNYHKIDNLNIDISDRGYVGLFGIIKGGNITNLSVNGNVSAKFDDDWVLCGGIAGEASEETSIKNCSFTGNVSSNKNGVGGIAGQLVRGGEISSCYFNGNVKTESENCGGIVGHVSDHFVVCNNKVSDCYAVGTVTASKLAGGIAGSSVRNQSESVYTVENNYYLDSMADTGINGHITTGCFKLSSNLMKNVNELLGEPFVYNNEESINDGYPIFEWQSTPYQFKGSGTAEDPYQISSKFELETMRDLVNSTYFGDKYCRYYYVQTADIDLENELFEPIGTRMKNGVNLSKPLFRGNYDGQGHEIRNLYVNKTGGDGYTGLFGSFYGAKTAIENLIVYGKVISEGSGVGGIAGEIVNGDGIVRNCAFIGDVEGKHTVGGIAGVIYQNGTIENCYHNGNVSGINKIGGIAGELFAGDHVAGISAIKNCYNIGSVTGSENTTGSITGQMSLYDNVQGEIYVINCFSVKGEAPITAIGNYNSYYVTALSENMLKNAAETLGAPFVTNTDPELNNGYPVFEWQLPKKTVLKGDANLDGNIDIADIIAIASYVGDNKNNPLSGEAIVAGDVHNTGDGLTSGDALMIQQYVAGICSLD